MLGLSNRVNSNSILYFPIFRSPISPTTPQSNIILNVDDYGKKASTRLGGLSILIPFSIFLFSSYSLLKRLLYPFVGGCIQVKV